jgi:hypothetical protein
MLNLRVRVNPHNNLETLAHYHVDVINQKLASGDHEGITLDCTSAIIAMAFGVEAVMNYVGAKKLQNWKERSPFKTKVAALEIELGFKFDIAVEPYKTISLLKEARDTMAHGQPIEFQVSVPSRAQISKVMGPSWASATEPQVVLAAYEQVKQFKKRLFGLAGIKLGASLTSAAGGGTTN